MLEIGENKTISISQQSYISKLLSKYKLECSKRVNTVLPTNFYYDPMEMERLTTQQKQQVEKFPTQQIIGALNYISVCSRPDITFAVGLLERFQDRSNLSTCHALKHLLKYLISTINEKLVYSGIVNSLVGFSDSDWG